MDVDRIKKLFVEGSTEKIQMIKVKLEELKRKKHDEMDGQIMDIYILAHGINSSSVFLPIKTISIFSKAIEKKVKEWLEDNFVLNSQTIDELAEDVDKLKIMIDNLDEYIGEDLL